MPKAHIIGLGRSGIASARLLKQDGWDVTLSDSKTSETLEQRQQELKQEGIAVQLNSPLTLTHSDLPELMVVSPGVPWDIPALKKARQQGVNTIGELELAWRYLHTIPWVGITGTNGKTTTTALTAAIFQAAGLNAPACGNIGDAACELALQDKGALNWIIAEISSYQVESSVELAPKIGIWTTFTPDHLHRHYSLENYYNIKASLLHRCEEQIFNGDDPYLRKRSSEWQNAYWTSVSGKQNLLCEEEKGIYIENEWVIAFNEPILPITSFNMVGAHNLQNLLMAVAAAKIASIENSAILHAIETFPGVPHRLEYICTWQGIDFINDSKATNYDAAEVGLASVKSPAILIAGGEAKEGNDTAWIATIKQKAAMVLLIGEAAEKFAQRLQESDYENYEIVETMEGAVKRSTEVAQAKNASVVLLSPACASFDQYDSFEHRGEHFRQLCQEWL